MPAYVGDFTHIEAFIPSLPQIQLHIDFTATRLGLKTLNMDYDAYMEAGKETLYRIDLSGR